jgi:hypothetical protein
MAFLDLSADDIIASVQAIASAAAGGPVVVRLGEELLGYRNVAVDLPARRCSAAEGRLLRSRVRAALETGGVTLAEHARAPKVAGEIRGSIRVRDVGMSWGDASGLVRAPGQG